MARHPHRLQRRRYIGAYTHFLTACVYDRQEAFRDHELALETTEQLLLTCRKHGFAVFAHTLMPDHVHVLFQGLRQDSDFLKCLNRWRQLSGYWHRQKTGRYLWQEGYWDFTLRDDDSLLSIGSYIVNNPVVAGLAASPTEYPFSGSERFSIAELGSYQPVKPRAGDI